ncbi:hypothetical protein CSV69_08320 [Sporosarcina sp. P26b]|uniref:hypothetical protein n=1 Tax=Sporosarcina TaxID=1569 RepID=UPI000A17DE54|nr:MULTISPECIES: hypothetical protein [Sporosarcina]ARK22386.1 hypothetical protein SporoP32a_13110 [Sporosarcina ureae]PIC96124.1 hypothetical protein CSV69_08320 [Sporosarcina sp. P26b]
MNKRWFAIYTWSIAIIIGCLFGSANSTEASERITGTFVKANYEEVLVDKDTTKKELRSVTIKNDAGRTATYTVDKYTRLSVDTIAVKIDAFKLGMKVEADIQNLYFKTLHAKTDTPGAVIEPNAKAYSGMVTYMDRDRKGLTITLDDGRVKNVYINSETQFFKKGKLTTSSSLYEGDRVNIKFSVYNSNYITLLDILEPGVQVAGLYKGTLHQIDPINRKIIVRDETKFQNWHWYENNPKSTTSYYYSTKTPIYFENKPVPHNQLRKYANMKVYLATVNKNGKEQVERIIIQKNAERTFYEPLQSFNGKTKEIRLMDSQRFRYHDGSILIRNGRLVSPESLGAYGTAFVAASGPIKTQYANIIHISNDGLNSPNLSDHSIYFGKISGVLGYKLRLSDASELKNNVWSSMKEKDLNFNNETYAVEEHKGEFTTLIPQMDLRFYMNRYAYFYISDDNQVTAIQLTDGSKIPANITLAGRLSKLDPAPYGKVTPTKISVRNVSRWMKGAWADQAEVKEMNIQQATFIKDGVVIQPSDLEINDRLFIIAESVVKGKIILVD